MIPRQPRSFPSSATRPTHSNLGTGGAIVHARGRVMQWASNRQVIGTDIPLSVGSSLITSAAQAAAALVTTVAMLGTGAWMALLATGLVHLSPDPGWLGAYTAWRRSMNRVIAIGGWVILIDLVCGLIIAAVHLYAAATRSAAASDSSADGPSEMGRVQV